MESDGLIIEEPIEELSSDNEISSSSSLLSDEQFNELLEHIDGLSSSSDEEEETDIEDVEVSRSEDIETEEEESSSTEIIVSCSSAPEGYYEAIIDTQTQTVFYLSLIFGILVFLVFALGLKGR